MNDPVKKIPSIRLSDFMITLITGFSGIVTALLLIMISSQNPELAIEIFLTGPLRSGQHFAQVIEMSIPLIFTACASCIILRGGRISLITEGAFFAGGLAAAAVAITEGVPAHPVTAMLFGALIGAMLASIPAMIQTKFNIGEFWSSLLLNVVILFGGLKILDRFLHAPFTELLISRRFRQSAKLPVIFKVLPIHSGVFIALLIAFLTYFCLYRSKVGALIRLSGSNVKYSFYSDERMRLIFILFHAAGGALAGLGGAVEVLGLYKRFTWIALTGHGILGIVVALIARGNALYIPAVAFFLVYIRVSSMMAEHMAGLGHEMTILIQSVIIVLITLDAFLSKWRHGIIIKDGRFKRSK